MPWMAHEYALFIHSTYLTKATDSVTGECVASSTGAGVRAHRVFAVLLA